MSEKVISRALPGEHAHITTDPWTEPYWQACKAHKLTAAQCTACGTFRMPPSPFCGRCQSQQVSWPDLPGTGTVYSFAVCNKSPFAGVPDFTYVPIIVELDGAPGVRIVSNLIDAEVDAVHIGMRITVAWHDIADGWTLPVFKPL